jgi:predicted DNA-binding antitoxin AbrB/MazE fold protein
MSETVTAIYEQGVLRPLTPLDLPEHEEVQIQIITPRPHTKTTEKQRARQVLLAAGVIRPHPTIKQEQPISESRLASAARSLAKAGPLSDVIITERDER